MLGRGLLKEFPNPNRIGCPGLAVLKRIASQELPLSEAERWLDHLGSCSPCYADFRKLRETYERRRKRRLLALAASILFAATATGWALLHKGNENLVAQTAILDLRDRSVARGAEPNPGEQPLELSRTASNVKILLPLGSSEGSYDVRIFAHSGESLVTTTGTATLNDHVTSLHVALPLDSVHRGEYVLQIRRPESAWSSYRVVLR